jgi:transposase
MLGDTHQHRHLRQQDGYRRIEVITGERRRRQWSDEEKARIVSESFAPGANVSGVARRHGVSGGLLFKWRRNAPQAPAAPAPFIPVTLAAGGSGEDDASSAAPCCAIEIELAGARILVHGPVCKAALKTVLAALRETA